MANETKLTTDDHLEIASVNIKRYILSALLELTNAITDELNGIKVELIEGTQTASTNAWTGVSKDSALYKGKFIIYKLPYAGTSNATLNLTLADGTKTGAKNIYRYASTRLKTEYGANYYIPLIYNGTYWFALADFGSTTNYYDRTRIANAVATASGAVQAVCFVGTTDGINYKQLSSGTTFDVNYPVLYNATAVDDGAAMSTGLYFAIPSVNLQTVLGDEERTFAEKVPIYLKGTLSGSTFTVHSDILTTTVPTSDDGFLYLRVGFTYSIYQVYVMLFENNFFAYKNGAFQEVNLLALKSLTDIRGQQIDTTYIKDISGSDGVLTLTKGDDTSSTVPCGTSGSVLSTVPVTVDGGLWYETTSTAPIIKILQGGSTYYLYTNQLVSPNLTLSSSTATVTTGTSQTVTLTYSGNGSVTLSNPNTSTLTATYNASTKKITLTSKVAAGSSATVSLGIALSESGNYAADSQTLTVTCQGGLANPNLKVTPAAITVSGGVVGYPSTGTATVSYAGSGTVTVTPSSGLTDVSYNSSTKVITVLNYGNDQTGTVAVSLSAAGNYASASASLSVTKQSSAPAEELLEEFEIEINGNPITLDSNHRSEVYATPPFAVSVSNADSFNISAVGGQSETEMTPEYDSGGRFYWVGGEAIDLGDVEVIVTISAEGFYTATVTVILE